MTGLVTALGFDPGPIPERAVAVAAIAAVAAMAIAWAAGRFGGPPVADLWGRTTGCAAKGCWRGPAP